MDTYQRLDRAVAGTAAIVKGIGEGDLVRPTPCTEWNVHQLLNHVVGALWLADGLFADRAPRHAAGPGALPESDLVGSDPTAAYAEASAAALASARLDGTLERPHTTPVGQLPGPVLAGFTTLDVVVHGWDLARATGQRADFDPEVVEDVLAFALEAVTDDTRAPFIGPALPAAPDAAAIDRLIAHMGRRP